MSLVLPQSLFFTVASHPCFLLPSLRTMSTQPDCRSNLLCWRCEDLIIINRRYLKNLDLNISPLLTAWWKLFFHHSALQLSFGFLLLCLETACFGKTFVKVMYLFCLSDCYLPGSSGKRARKNSLLFQSMKMSFSWKLVITKLWKSFILYNVFSCALCMRRLQESLSHFPFWESFPRQIAEHRSLL